MTKTMSIRMDRDNYEFLNELQRKNAVICPKQCEIWFRAAEFCSQ